jgi:hypothetical protein
VRTSGSATISATSQAAMCNSTIITRFSVPTSSAVAMPTETWNSDRRSSRGSGRPGLAASANGITCGSMRCHSSRTVCGMGRRNFTAASSSMACDV